MRPLAALLAVALLMVPGRTMAGDTTLERGDSGPAVAEVQTILAGFGYTVVVDSRFGPQTERAVKSWQRSNGLRADGIVGNLTLASLRAAVASTPAVRVGNAAQATPTVPPPGLNGLPFAPADLTGCDEMKWYRVQAGLPDAFDGIGYRESRCRNEYGVRTFCCYGYWQNYISSHLSRQSAYRQRIIDVCQVDGADDINSDNPLDKQRQACVTFVVWSISGLSPWRATA